MSAFEIPDFVPAYWIPDETRRAVARVIGTEFPSVDRVCDLLSYLHATGQIEWKIDRGTVREASPSSAGGLVSEQE